MDTAVLTAIVSGASAIGGAFVATASDSWRYRAERRERARAELEGRLIAFASAADALTTELRELPVQGPRAQLIGAWMERRMPTADFFFGRIARLLLGRRLYAAIERFQEAGNALMLGAPREVLAAFGEFADVLGRFPHTARDQFFDELEAARTDFNVVARLAATDALQRQGPLRRLAKRLGRRRRPVPELPARITSALEKADRGGAAQEDPMARWRRRPDSDTWHWCPNCSTYPTRGYLSTARKPRSGELCNECRAKDRHGECR
jgi:hypothetical protein